MNASKPWSFIGQRVAGGNHYTIYHNGVVQPFGAMFYGKRGDVKKDVERAVNLLNRLHQEAIKQGKVEYQAIDVKNRYDLDCYCSVVEGLFKPGTHQIYREYHRDVGLNRQVRREGIA